VATREVYRRRTAVKRTMLVAALGALLALAVATPVALGQAEQQGSPTYGQTGKLAAAWWQWAGSKPVPKNPAIGEYSGGPKCNGRPVSATPGNKQWWFLAGTGGGTEPGVERTCTVPAGRRLFFPVANTVFVITEPGETEEIARQAANEFMDSVLTDPDLSIAVSVDGQEVLRRADSPLFTAEIPEDNVFDSPTFDLPAGSYDGVADGLWVTVPPLSKGKHTVHFELSAPNVGEEGFTQNITYRLTVK
jgi:hypothetical protein